MGASDFISRSRIIGTIISGFCLGSGSDYPLQKRSDISGSKEVKHGSADCFIG